MFFIAYEIYYVAYFMKHYDVGLHTHIYSYAIHCVIGWTNSDEQLLFVNNWVKSMILGSEIIYNTLLMIMDLSNWDNLFMVKVTGL